MRAEGRARLLFLVIVSTALAILASRDARAASEVEAKVQALRMVGTITGGRLTIDDPLFEQIVARLKAGEAEAAADLVAKSPHFASHLARRLALQMQTPALEVGDGKDNDSTAFLIAHFAGAVGTAPSISTIFSENATYLVMAPNGTVHASALSAGQLAALDWTKSLVRQDGQNVKAPDGSPVALPEKHVGGFATLSDKPNDGSFAMYGAMAGTNLRMIEGIWQISTGLSLTDVKSTAVPASFVPKFVPEYDPNFLQGQGQPACISCHGGGMASLRHGYATVADVFDFTGNNGLVYIAAPTQATMKSLGSDPGKRGRTSTCNLSQNPTPVCNPDSEGADPDNKWDLSLWKTTGVLNTMKWKGNVSGQGLNELGRAIGQAGIVYEFLTKRVIGEICPMGTFSSAEVSAIALAANPSAEPKGTDDLRTIVAKVASHPSCL